MSTILRTLSPLLFTADVVNGLSISNKARTLLLSAAIGFAPVWQAAYAASSYDAAKTQVVNQPCLDGETVDQYLDHKRRPSHRDLGWRVFEDDDGYIVERSFMVSKAMEIRYRWHIDKQDAIYPTNSRTEDLCS